MGHKTTFADFFFGGGELNFIYSDITKIDRIKVTVEAEPLSV